METSGAFRLVSPFKPTGDQPQAIEKLVNGIEDGNKAQTLLGVTGSGKRLQWPISSSGFKGPPWL